MSPDGSFNRFQSSFLTVAIDFHETVLSSSGSDISQYSNLFVSDSKTFQPSDLTRLCGRRSVPEASSVMSVGVKRASARQEGAFDPTSWRPRTWHPAREKLTLLEVMGSVWTFQDPRNDRLYRCEVDPDDSGRWFFKDVRTEGELISEADAARLVGVSRQAIARAIVHRRLGTVDCNGGAMVRRTEVLALRIDPRRTRARKQSAGNVQS